MPILSILLALPIVFALLIGFAPAKSARTLAFASALATFVVSLYLLTYAPPPVAAGVVAVETAARQFGFVERYAWLPEFGIGYALGVDGLSMWLVLLTTFLQIFAVGSAAGRIREREKEFYVWLCVLETALIGSFAALDLILFYIFFEASLVPMYFLIGIWGNTARRTYAAVKFFLFTLAGSLVMLVGLLAVYLNVRTQIPAGAFTAPLDGRTVDLATTGTFDFLILKSVLAAHPLPFTTAAALFGAFAIAFAVKTPLFPFHSWQPDAYSEAPTPAVVMMGAVLSKLGTYGFYRFCLPLFPDAVRLAAPYLVALGAVAIVYGALVAAVQRDLRRLIAFSSISHLGFVIVGLFSLTPQGLTGAAIQMISHGISTGALFLLIGMLEARRGTRTIRAFGGLWEQMPYFGRVFLIVVLSSIALPLTNGFVGEFLILLGAFQMYPFWTAVAATGVILSAVYMLWMFQRVMYGPVDKIENRRLHDLTPGEKALVVPLVLLIFLQGVVPTLFTRYMAPSVDYALRDATPGQERVRYEKIAVEPVNPQP